MIKIVLTVTTASALGFAFFAVSGNDEDRDEGEITVSLDQVPPAVKAAIVKATQGAEIEEIEQETENGKTVYEVEASRKGVVFELEFDDVGTLVGFEIEDEEDDDGDDDENEQEADDVRNDSANARDDNDRQQDDDQTISLDRLPEAARKTLLEQAGSASIEEIEVEHTGGTKLYEALWKVNGVEHEAVVTADGDLVELEEIIPADAAPTPVRNTAKKSFRNGAALTFEKKTLLLYEVEEETEERETGVLIAPTGQRIEIEAEDDDDDKDD